jgi:tetratricopeptide (TPR) repeat protein
VASYQQEQGDCRGAIERMEKLLKISTFLDSYLRLKFANLIKNCLTLQDPQFSEKIAQRGVEILKENSQIQPYFTRNWLFLGILTNFLLEKEKAAQAPKEKILQLKKEVDLAFEKALKLSPQRPEILIEWLKSDLTIGDFPKAKEKGEKCLQLNPDFSYCYWFLGLTEIYLGKESKAKEYLQIAEEKGYALNSEISLLQLSLAYAFQKNYQQLIQIYQKLIKIAPQNPQYHASLATSYREIGELEKAKKEALKVLELSPKSQKEVEKFLRSLKP